MIDQYLLQFTSLHFLNFLLLFMYLHEQLEWNRDWGKLKSLKYDVKHKLNK